MGNILLIHKGGAGGVRGTEACVIGAIKAMRQDGHQIRFARNLPVIDHLVQNDVEKILPVEIPEILISKLNSHIPLRSYIRCLSILAREIREFQPDVIIASGGLPCQLAVPLGLLFRKYVLCHYHHPATKHYYHNWLLPFVDEFIFPSVFTQQDIRKKIKREGKVIYNGVDTKIFAPVPRNWSFREQLNIPRDSMVIGQVGQLVDNKRPEFLVRAFTETLKTMPDLHLCLVGKGPLEAHIRAQIDALNLQHKITVTGYVEDVLPYYQHVFDVNVLVSSEEGLGISILEGAACGLPSLISDCTGLSETTINNVTGLTFSPNDESALIKAIASFALDREFRVNAGHAARELVEKKFSLAQYMKKFSETINLILNQSPPKSTTLN